MELTAKVDLHCYIFCPVQFKNNSNNNNTILKKLPSKRPFSNGNLEMEILLLIWKLLYEHIYRHPQMFDSGPAGQIKNIQIEKHFFECRMLCC